MRNLSIVAMLAGALFSGLAPAADEAVINGPEASVGADSIRAEVSNWDLDKLKNLPDSPSIELFVNDLILRSVLAARARGDGLDKDPLVRQRVQNAVDKVLYDAYMERAEDAKIDRAGAVALARDEYRANPDRYTVPEQIRVRHILIRPNAERSREQAREIAEGLLTRAENGESFEELAKAYSEDPTNAEKGGDLGFFPRKKMVRPFDRAAFKLKTPGELSKVVETGFGYHIIQLVEHKDAYVRPFEEIQDPLAESIYRRMRGQVRAEIALPIVDREKTSVDLERLKEILREEAAGR
ncbi:MAG: peptidyl-prolyl cis-trans isomerase [Zoogloeaceae bacterium]|nr:peptidyl-prolyl cis-trans isomerase [Rhodocyclaceae bacterium]MCP5237231.1 peptidyl-prolyl cis-trans isomerase [Zoogloeaceae bacterium]